MIFLCRHGQTAHNRDGVLQGRSDPELTATGIRQAERLAMWIASQDDVSRVFTSPLTRALATASEIATALGVEPDVSPLLIERDFGPFEGLTRSALESRRSAIGLSNGDPTQDWLGVDGVEQDSTIAARFCLFLDEIGYQADPTQRIVVVTHSGVVKAVLQQLCFASKERNRTFFLREGGAARLQHDSPERFVLSGLMQNADLPPIRDSTWTD